MPLERSSRKLTGYVLLGAAAFWLYQQGKPSTAGAFKPAASPVDAWTGAVNPRYRLPNVTSSPNGALPADTESAFPALPYSSTLQGTPGPGPGRGSTHTQARALEPSLKPWGQQPAYSQPIGPAFQNKPRRP